MSLITAGTPRTTPEPSGTRRPQVDPRGGRFAASLTVVVLAAVLLLAPASPAVVLLGAQTLVFALGALGGPSRSPYSWLFGTLVRPRLGPPRETEDAAPPRFAQAVGLGFAAVGLVGFLLGLPLLGSLATGAAVAAAFLNAAFGFCLGCEVYLLAHRLIHRTPAPSTTAPTGAQEGLAA